jgi:hypothetical protein
VSVKKCQLYMGTSGRTDPIAIGLKPRVRSGAARFSCPDWGLMSMTTSQAPGDSPLVIIKGLREELQFGAVAIETTRHHKHLLYVDVRRTRKVDWEHPQRVPSSPPRRGAPEP